MIHFLKSDKQPFLYHLIPITLVVEIFSMYFLSQVSIQQKLYELPLLKRVHILQLLQIGLKRLQKFVQTPDLFKIFLMIKIFLCNI